MSESARLPVRAARGGPDRDPAGDRSAPAVARPAAVPGLIESSPAVQRLVSVRGRHDPDLAGPPRFSRHPAHDDDTEALIKAVDDITQQAWGQIVSRPLFTGLNALTQSSGYVARWVEKLGEAVDQHYAGPMLAAQFGYAVEALTTFMLKDAQAGWKLNYQIASGGTRPDIVATKNGRTVWLDLTSGGGGSHEHIYLLKRWDTFGVCPHPHAELTYPACDSALVGTMLANAAKERAGNPNPATVDAAALTAQIAAANARLRANVARWKAKYVALLRRSAQPATHFDGDPDPDLQARNTVYEWMNDTFGTWYRTEQDEPAPRVPRQQPDARSPYARPRSRSYSRQAEEDPRTRRQRLEREREERMRRAEDARECSSVLEALGITSRDYGFVITSYSAARGVAFLEEKDPGERTDGVA